jgi:hypothetical protein
MFSIPCLVLMAAVVAFSSWRAVRCMAWRRAELHAAVARLQELHGLRSQNRRLAERQVRTAGRAWLAVALAGWVALMAEGWHCLMS